MPLEFSFFSQFAHPFAEGSCTSVYGLYGCLERCVLEEAASGPNQVTDSIHGLPHLQTSNERNQPSAALMTGSSFEP